MNKYASNLASRAELGRFPVAVSALLQAIKYWLYLLQNPFEKATRLSYLSLIHNDGEVHGTFNHNIGCLLKNLGFSHVWQNKGTLSVNKLIHAIKCIMLSRYEKYFNSVITCSSSSSNTGNNKLRTYSKFKHKISFENYLTANVNRSIISNFTKLRISNHRLEMEIGRYSKTPPHLRFCKTCNLNAVEDEFHFICTCNAYSDIRKQFFKEISDIVIDFEKLSLYDKFLFIMSANEMDIISIVLQFVTTCFGIKKKRIDEHKQHASDTHINN